MSGAPAETASTDSARADDASAVEFLHRLVSIPSVSGGERPAVEWFVESAARLGFESRIDEAGNAVASRRPIAPTPGDPVEIVLLGHIDTVPGEVPVRIHDGVLHGRGSVDAKGPLAAMLFASARANLDPPLTLHVIGAVGEETPESPGARHILDRYRPIACIIGEPSGTRGFVLGYKGRLIADAEFRVECSHSAGPHGSAGDAAFAWWRDVTTTIEALNAERDGAFNTLQASLRSIRSESDGTHEVARLSAGFRVPPGVTPATLEVAVRATGSDSDGPRIRPTALSFTGHTEPIEAARGNQVAAALSSAIRDEGMTPRPLLKTGTADMNIVGPAWGCPIAAYGPGDSALDHTPNEHVRLEDYLRAIRVLERALARITSSHEGD